MVGTVASQRKDKTLEYCQRDYSITFRLCSSYHQRPCLVAGGLAGGLAGWLVGWLVGRLVGVGWMAGW